MDESKTSKRPDFRECSSCAGKCRWVDDAWVCQKCGDEWYPDHGPQFAAPQPETREVSRLRYAADLHYHLRLRDYNRFQEIVRAAQDLFDNHDPLAAGGVRMERLGRALESLASIQDTKAGE